MAQALMKTFNTNGAIAPLQEMFRPKFNFISSKWAEVRQEKTESLRERFVAEPMGVYIFKDAKLGSEQLALMKKSNLEQMIKLNRDLVSGEAAIKESVQGVFHAVKILLAAIEDKQLKKDAVIKTAAEGLQFQMEGVFKSTIIFANAPENKLSPDLSQEELELYDELKAAERD